MKISKKITAFFINKNIITRDQREIYEYGFELIIADITNFLLILFISIGYNCLCAGIIYLFCFVSMRVFCGGFHAESRATCRIYMLISFIAFIKIYCLLNISKMHIAFIGLIIAWIPILCCAPVIHKNRRLSLKYRRKNRIMALVISGLWTLASVVLVLANVQWGIAIIVTIWIVSTSMILGRMRLNWKEEKKVNILNLLLPKVANLVLFIAILSAGTASCFGAYQPDIPKELQK